MVDRLEKLGLAWVHPMHGGSFERPVWLKCVRALREKEFAHHGMLLGREITKIAPM